MTSPQEGDAAPYDDSEVPTAVEITEEAAALPQLDSFETSRGYEEDRTAPVPVTLITGCLGAGKTTLVQYILTQQHGMRIAVIMNEFGQEQGLEGEMQSRPQGTYALEEWIELANGCLCCTVKSDFLLALEALMEQRNRFDSILIETTGLADPGPVAAALWTDGELRSSVCLDAIITVVDAHNLRRQLADARPPGAVNEAEQQIAYADVIMLNKVDLVKDAAQLAEVEHAIHAINSAAEIIRTQRSRVDLRRILDRGAYRRDRAAAAEAVDEHSCSHADAAPCSLCEQPGPGPACADAPHAADGTSQHAASAQSNGHAHRRHDSGVSTVSVRESRRLHLERLRRWLEELLWEIEEGESSRQVLRAKGIVHVEEDGRSSSHVVQAVREIYDMTEMPAHDVNAQSRLVLIGRRLDPVDLQAGFSACASK